MSITANTWGIKRSDRGYLKIGSLLVPVQDGTRMIYPPMYRDAQGTSNNVFDVSYYKGLYYPTFNGPVDVTNDWFTATNMNAWFVTRGASVGVGFDDLAQIALAGSTVNPIYSDGNKVHTMLGAKGNSFVIGARQDEQLRCALGFMGADKTSAAFSPTGISPNVLQRTAWDGVQFVSGVHGVTDFTFSHMNNLRPNPIMGEGTGTALVEVNAGKPRIMLDLTVDATGTFPTNGSSIVFTITTPNGPLGTGSTTQTYTIASIRIDNPDDIGKTPERAAQTFHCTCMSADGIAFPYSIT